MRLFNQKTLFSPNLSIKISGEEEFICNQNTPADSALNLLSTLLFFHAKKSVTGYFCYELDL
jgi:hypothetical protein